MRYAFVILLNLFGAHMAAQSPAINSGGIVNAASQAPPGLPNSAIAQGSVFAINGTRLGSAASVQVSGSGTSLAAPVVSTSATQIVAIMPSGIPAGSGTVTVTTPAGGNPVSVVTPAAPGATINILGTGLGALAADDVNPPALNDISSQVTVYVGLAQAQVTYAGRSGNAPGQDVVTFTIPADAIVGCYVPVAVVFNNVASNWASIAIAADGVSCPVAALSPEQIQLMQQAAASGDNEVVGTVALVEDTATGFRISTLNGITDTGNIGFSEYTPDLASGTLSVTAPNGTARTAESTPGSYSGTLGTDQNGGSLFLNQSGINTVSATGGPAVGPWSVQLPAPPKFTWTNAASLTTVSRNKGVTINWTGGDPNGIVLISGFSVINMSLSGLTPIGTAAWFVCTAPMSAGTFVVPPVVTQSLPASGTLSVLGASIALSAISVRGTSQWVPFTAPGITVGAAGVMFGTSLATTFQ